MSKYNELIERLFNINLTGGIKLGLDNCIQLDRLLEYPSKSFKCVHVAGTNGKGSVTKKIATGLQRAGYRVGQYTSPHLSTFRERICVNGEMISEEEVTELLPHLFNLAEREKIPATFFEITTLLALYYFMKKKVDIAVIETGLGGRLDATNIVSPILSVITSISLDHTEILGNTVEEIALEKAGIIKMGIPVVLGPNTPQQFFHAYAQQIHCPVIQIGEQFRTFEEENTAIAKRCLQELGISNQAIDEGINARMPCRMELMTKKLPNSTEQMIVLDVGHNPDGLEHLFAAIKQRFPEMPLRVLFGLSKTKNLHDCLSIIKNNASGVHLVEACNGRGASTEQLYKTLLSLNTPPNIINKGGSIKEQLVKALQLAAENHELLVVCGTFFIMHDVRVSLDIKEPSDQIDVNERAQTSS